MEDLESTSSKSHQTMTVMVRAVITISDHWILYAELYEMGSTDAGSWSRQNVCIMLSPKLLNNSVSRGSGEGAANAQHW